MDETGLKTFLAATALAPYLRVKISDPTTSPPTVGLAGATDVSIGTVERRALAAGDPVTIRLVNAPGTVKVVASGPITGGNPMYGAASGKVAGSGTVIEGIALATSTADGDVIEGVRSPNTDLSAALATTNAATFKVDADSSTPKIALGAQTAGTGDYTTTIKPETTLSGDNAVICPEADGDTLVAVALAQTLTNKTLTSPTLNTPVIKRVNEAHTAGDTLTAAETGSVHTNTGAGGAIILVLPAAVVGLEFTFHVGAAQELKIDPNGSETIALPSSGVQGAAGKYISADAVGEWVKLYCAIAGTWSVQGYAGTWTAEG